MPALPLQDEEIKAVAESSTASRHRRAGRALRRGSDAPPPNPSSATPRRGRHTSRPSARVPLARPAISGHRDREAGRQGAAEPLGLGRRAARWGGRRPRRARHAEPKAPTATVTLPSGEKIEGPLVRVDDFLDHDRAGRRHQRTIRRDGDAPKVEIKDPLEPHKRLLATLTDKDMQDVTAYLATLK